MKERMLSQIIELANSFGLSLYDVANAKMFLENHEFELSFDTIMTQLYEYDIKIDNEFYILTLSTLDKMKIDKAKYEYVKELIL